MGIPRSLASEFTRIIQTNTVLVTTNEVTQQDPYGLNERVVGLLNNQSELTNMYHLFDEYRQRHHADKDETRYDAILDVMDYITGWCSPQNRLFDSELRT